MAQVLVHAGEDHVSRRRFVRWGALPLLLSGSLVGCGYVPPDPAVNQAELPVRRSVGASSARSKAPLQPSSCLLEALKGGRCETLPSEFVKVETREVGLLSVPSGRIVACDAITFEGPVAFSRQTPTGAFPVRLVVVHRKNGGQRIAAAVLDFAPGAPDHWDLAVTSGQDPSNLQPDQYFGYSVDSGTGSFMDMKAAEQLEARMGWNPFYFQNIINQMEQTDPVFQSWAILDLGKGKDAGLNAAVFSSGFGDGAYPSYWGVEGDKLLCLVTDFGLLDVEGDEPSTVP